MAGCYGILSPREEQVLSLIVYGHSTKQIAGRLDISFKTAACHRSHVMDKLGVHDVASLVRVAIMRGLVNLCAAEACDSPAL